MGKITITDTTLNIFIRNNPRNFGSQAALQIEPYKDDVLQEAFNMYVSKYRGYSYTANGGIMGSKKYTFEI